MMVTFTIPGQPIPKGRPRFARRGAHVMAYTDAKTAGYERMVKLAAGVAMAGRAPLAGPVHLSIDLVLQVPASWSNKKRALALAGEVRATKKPDLDNFCKLLGDGLNGVCWIDDSQVVQITMRKDYGEVPCAVVNVREIDGEAA